MPPKRKSAPHPASRQSSQQATLSFHGKPNKITKPASPRHAKAKKDAVLEEAIARADVKAEAEPDSEERPTAEEAIAQQAADEAAALDDPLKADKEPIKREDVLGGRAQQSDAGALGGNGAGWADDEQVRARKITDAQIKKYWRAKEEQRLAPRLHQEDMSLYEKVLREWDMSGQYGPCIGIARLKRWKRANMLGLDPPVEVLAVLLKDVENGGKAQRAYVDELMSSKFVET